MFIICKNPDIKKTPIQEDNYTFKGNAFLNCWCQMCLVYFSTAFLSFCLLRLTSATTMGAGKGASAPLPQNFKFTLDINEDNLYVGIFLLDVRW